MLVLSRLREEEIVIGDRSAGQLYVMHDGRFVPVDPVRVLVADVRADRVRLAIDAAKSVPIHRLEVYRAIEAERKVGA